MKSNECSASSCPINPQERLTGDCQSCHQACGQNSIYHRCRTGCSIIFIIFSLSAAIIYTLYENIQASNPIGALVMIILSIIAGSAVTILGTWIIVRSMFTTFSIGRTPIEPKNYQLESVWRDYKGEYHIMIKMLESRLIELGFVRTSPTIYCDVPKDMPIWAKLNLVRDRQGNEYFAGSGEIHLHNAQEIRMGAAGVDPADDCPPIIVI